MSEFELILLAQQDTNDKQETFEIIADIIERSVGSEFSTKLADSLSEWCEIHNLCPVCGSDDLESKTVSEYRGEFWGEPTYEEMTYIRCSTCGANIN